MKGTWSRLTNRFEQAAYRAGLDSVAYRLWRYNPARLYRRYKDSQFDRELQVDTSGVVDRIGYEPTPVGIFREMLGGLELRHRDFVFVDFGSGKGRTLLLAAQYPFQKVVGVEFSPELHEIAEMNIRRVAPSLACQRVESVCMDAVRFPIPCQPALFYLFNPFKESVLTELLHNLGESLSSDPRTIFLIFYAPVRRGAPWDRRRILDACDFLTLIHSRETYAIYANREPIQQR